MNDRKKTLRQAPMWLNMSVVGIQFPVAIGIGYWIGGKLDLWLGTAPWCRWIFTVFGIAAGFLNLFRMTAEVTRQEEAEQRRLAQEQQGGEDGNGDRGPVA